MYTAWGSTYLPTTKHAYKKKRKNDLLSKLLSASNTHCGRGLLENAMKNAAG
jgi:hypothetical protein